MEAANTGELFATLLGAVVVAVMLVSHLATGRMSGARGLNVDRNEQPGLFRFVITMEVIAVIVFLGLACKAAIQLIVNRSYPR
jgi:hypothetical protein